VSPKAVALQSAGISGRGAPTHLARAVLELHLAQPVAGGAVLGALIDHIPFQFNPKEFSIQKSAKWTRKPLKGTNASGPPEFNGPEPFKLTLEAFFDATDSMNASVVKRVEQLFTCCAPTDVSLDKKNGMPPLVVLRWGNVTSFTAFITSVQAKYTLFSPDGNPIRATCSLALEEMPGSPPKQNPTSGALATRSSYTLVAGDSLASIAYREYGDPALWRLLAGFNGIDDPLRLRPGLSLLIPGPEELFVAAEAGR
jgi:hypothetical protein